jgi:ribosomal protein S26
MRGKERIVICDACGRRIPLHKAVEFYKPIFFSTDLKTKDDKKYFEMRKVYYCLGCAKTLGIFQKKKELAKKGKKW